MAENYQINVEVINKASATLSEIKSQLSGIASTGQSSFNSLNSSLQGVAQRAEDFSAAIKGVATVLAANEALKYIDSIQTLDNKLRLVTNSQAELNNTYNQLYNVSQNTRQALEPTINLYSKLALAQDQIGLSSGDLMKVVESFNKTLLISGASTQGAASALYQFAQAMQSGRLQGDELRTMLEVNPVLMKVLTEQTGFTTAELRKLASEGFLNAKIVGLALRDGLADLNDQMGKMPKTVGQAMQGLSNAFQATIRDFLDSSAAGGVFVGIIDTMTRFVVPLTVALGALATALAISALIQSVAFVMRSFALATELATVATGGLTTALTFLGTTPIGRVISLVGLAAGAFMMFSDSAKSTERPVSDLGNTTTKLGEQSKQAAKGSDELKKALEESGAMAKVNETAFSKYTDTIKEQIKYSNLFSSERRDMVEVEKKIQETVDAGRKVGKLYTQEQLQNMRDEAMGLLALRDARFKATDELEQRYKGYLQYIKTNQDKSLSDQQQYEKNFAQATIDRQNITKFTEEEYNKYIAALRADYSKKYVDLIQKEKLANMTENQKYAAELAQLEADRDAGRLSQDLNYEDAKYAIQKKYAQDYFKMAEDNRTIDMDSYGKYQAALMKFQQDAAAQAVLTEEQKNLVLRKMAKDYADATASEYSNLYSFMNNKLLEMTGISREKWGIMTDVVKLFGIDTNQLLKEAFATAITWIKGFTGGGGKELASFFTSTQGGFSSWGSNIAGTIEWLGNGIVSVFSQASDGMMTAMAYGFDWIAGAAKSLGNIMWDALSGIFDWAISNIGDIASAISGWGGGGGGGGGWGSIISTAVDWIGSLFAQGAAFEGGKITERYANGGQVITNPTTFPMANGSLGLLGEAGPEAILPLARTSNGDLGVKSISANTPMSQNVNVSFTINAIDGKDVKDMLVNNSTTITNIIRNAVQDKGIKQTFGVL